MSIWYCIPSARPVEEANKCLQAWRDRGYKLAILRNAPGDVMADVMERAAEYPGYGKSVNQMIAAAIKADPSAQWFVAGGDDMYPDMLLTPDEIAERCEKHFGGNMGCMQPTGDVWSVEKRPGQEFFPYLSSPWIGREFVEKTYGGKGPYWHGYYHYHSDTEIRDVAVILRCLVEMPDITHRNDHWKRKPGGTQPRHLDKAQAQYEVDLQRYESRRRDGFPESNAVSPTPCCIIVTHRFGDIASALPIAAEFHRQGRHVTWIVHEKFSGILDAVSYVRPVIFQGDMTDMTDAARLAKQNGFTDDNTLILQPCGNPVYLDIPCSRYNAEAWGRAGMLGKFHKLPLVFDRRDKSRDAETLAAYLPRNGKPTMLLCMLGHSSAWTGTPANEFAAWVTDTATKQLGWNVVDIGSLHLPHVLDLIPLLEAADVLVSIDTLPVHLSYATNIPTLVLSKKGEWGRSEPRSNWIGQLTFTEAATEEGRAKIAQILKDCPATMGTLVRTPEQMMMWRIRHVTQEYPQGNLLTAKREAKARGSWSIIWSMDRAWTTLMFNAAKHANRSTHGRPYIKDVFDFACAKVRPGEAIAFTATDVSLVPETPGILRDALAVGNGCCFSARVEVDSITHPLIGDELATMDATDGSGVFCFTPAWWKAHRDEMPDLVLGRDAWHLAMQKIMLKSNPNAAISPPLCYHERHDKPQVTTALVEAA